MKTPFIAFILTLLMQTLAHAQSNAPTPQQRQPMTGQTPAQTRPTGGVLALGFIALVASVSASAQNNNNNKSVGTANTNTRVVDRDDDMDWGWLGLAGLAG
jgi:hypothetical protein